MKLFLKTLLYPVVVYAAMMGLYIILQDVYVSQCTVRNGFIHLFMNIPTCTKINNILQIIGDQFISLFLSLVGLLMAVNR